MWPWTERPDNQNRISEPTSLGDPGNTCWLMVTGPGLAWKKAAHRVVRQVRNWTDSGLLSKTWSLAGYPDPCLMLWQNKETLGIIAGKLWWQQQTTRPGSSGASNGSGHPSSGLGLETRNGSVWFQTRSKAWPTASWWAFLTLVPLNPLVVPSLAKPVGSNLRFWFLGFSIYGHIQISYC